MKPGALRPAVHAGLLSLALLEPVLGKWGMAGAAFGAFLLNLLVLPRTAFGRALRREGEPRWNGLVAYPLAVAAAYALFPSPIAAVAWAVMGFGDPAAALVGAARKDGPRIPWNRRKSVAGSAAFLGAAWIGSVGILTALQAIEGRPVDPLPFVLPCCGTAMAGAVAESLPFGEDNLVVVLVAGAVLTAAVSVR